MAAAALLGASSGAWAQMVVRQLSVNTAKVTNGTDGLVFHNPDTINLAGGNLGIGASVLVGASGAVSAKEVSGIDTSSGFVLPTGGFGHVTQAAINSGAISDVGVITDGGSLSDGASASISATGAAASLSLTGVDISSPAAQTSTTVGNVLQGAVNHLGTVSNIARSFSVGDLSGNGASASITATGAIASVGISFIGENGAPTIWSPSTIGNILQLTFNDASISNSVIATASMQVGTLSGDAASARISASGAIAAVSLMSVDSTDQAKKASGNTLGRITQIALNTGSVTNAPPSASAASHWTPAVSPASAAQP
ncbi:MAG: hypothetical protein ACRECV_00905 [Xanthobacteraceae bacterium]